MRTNADCHTRFHLLVLIITCCWVPVLAQEKTGNGTTNPEIDALKTQVANQQVQIEELKQALEQQKKLINELIGRSGSQALVKPATAETALVPGARDGPLSSSDAIVGPAIGKPTRPKVNDDEASPLTLKLGKVYLTPSGFLDFTTFIRSKNVGSGIGTNFASIPFDNSTSGELSEFRFTAQNSRLGLRLDTKIKDTRLTGLLETDFIGFSPGNVAVTTNSNNLRFRLFWLDVQRGKWEILGGQSWSLLTPNRKGLSPLPANIFNTLNVDPNNQVGLVWSRDPQFRVVYHASETVTLGVSLEASEQYAGGSAGAGRITLPAALVDSYGPQLNTGDSTFNVPNLHPDIIVKVAFDPKLKNRQLHYEFAGLLSTFKFFNPLDQRTHSAVGGGVSAGVNYEVVNNLRLIANGFYSDGGARWIFGLGPNLIIKDNGDPSLVHSASTLSGFEYQATPKDLFDGY